MIAGLAAGGKLARAGGTCQSRMRSSPGIIRCGKSRQLDDQPDHDAGEQKQREHDPGHLEPEAGVSRLGTFAIDPFLPTPLGRSTGAMVMAEIATEPPLVVTFWSSLHGFCGSGITLARLALTWKRKFQKTADF
jgi:hypothetical protein